MLPRVPIRSPKALCRIRRPRAARPRKARSSSPITSRSRRSTAIGARPTTHAMPWRCVLAPRSVPRRRHHDPLNILLLDEDGLRLRGNHRRPGRHFSAPATTSRSSRPSTDQSGVGSALFLSPITVTQFDASDFSANDGRRQASWLSRPRSAGPVQRRHGLTSSWSAPTRATPSASRTRTIPQHWARPSRRCSTTTCPGHRAHVGEWIVPPISRPAPTSSRP